MEHIDIAIAATANLVAVDVVVVVVMKSKNKSNYRTAFQIFELIFLFSAYSINAV